MVVCAYFCTLSAQPSHLSCIGADCLFSKPTMHSNCATDICIQAFILCMHGGFWLKVNGVDRDRKVLKLALLGAAYAAQVSLHC